MPARSAAEILSAFPGPITLKPSPGKWLKVLLGCLVFVAISVWMIVRPSTPDGGLFGMDQHTVAWGALIFFGFGAIVAGVVLLPGAGALTLDRDGFEMTNLFRRTRTAWTQASGFIEARIPPANLPVVAYDDVRAAAHAVAALNIKITGRNAALSDTYGLAVAELAQLMSDWHDRALTQA